jgi:6-phosphofructokinase
MFITLQVYSELIGNLCLDTASASKYFHFVRVMGLSLN